MNKPFGQGEVLACTVYKSLRKDQTYVYVPQSSDLADLPEALQGLLGELEKVLDLQLSAEQRLARADPVLVLQCIREQGYFVQMPPGKELGQMAEANSPVYLQ